MHKFKTRSLLQFLLVGTSTSCLWACGEAPSYDFKNAEVTQSLETSPEVITNFTFEQFGTKGDPSHQFTTAIDSSSAHVNGTIELVSDGKGPVNMNDPEGKPSTNIQVVAGVQGQGLHLDGNTFIRVQGSNVDRTGDTGAFTLSMWVKPDSTPAAKVQWLITRQEAKTHFAHFGIGLYGDKLIARTHFFIIGEPGPDPSNPFKTATIPSGRWTHVSATYDGITLTIYANGELIQSLDLGWPISRDTTPMLVGGFEACSDSADDTFCLDHAGDLSCLTRPRPLPKCDAPSVFQTFQGVIDGVYVSEDAKSASVIAAQAKNPDPTARFVVPDGLWLRDFDGQQYAVNHFRGACALTFANWQALGLDPDHVTLTPAERRLIDAHPSTRLCTDSDLDLHRGSVSQSQEAITYSAQRLAPRNSVKVVLDGDAGDADLFVDGLNTDIHCSGTSGAPDESCTITNNTSGEILYQVKVSSYAGSTNFTVASFSKAPSGTVSKASGQPVSFGPYRLAGQTASKVLLRGDAGDADLLVTSNVPGIGCSADSSSPTDSCKISNTQNDAIEYTITVVPYAGTTNFRVDQVGAQ